MMWGGKLFERVESEVFRIAEGWMPGVPRLMNGCRFDDEEAERNYSKV
jgi:hypothetical protein